MKVYVWVALLVGILVVGVACTKATDDSDLTGQVQAKLSGDSGLQGKQLTVQTSGGVVTLSGTVDNDAQRAAASRYASTVPGIKEVVNNLQVAPASAMMPMDQAAPAPEPARPAAKPRPSAPRRPAASSTAMAAPAPAQAAAPAAPAAPPAPKKVSIPSGTTMAIRLVDEIDSETAQPGQTFRATLDSPLSVEGDVVVPAGYDVQGHIIDVKSAGKFAGRSELV
ncbi:MAG: BON domain-containing protein, partial [Candidatus Koribacter versatilis]|nr:BON domain-containing protein [Candidatus Koribacter versatilis]